MHSELETTAIHRDKEASLMLLTCVYSSPGEGLPPDGILHSNKQEGAADTCNHMEDLQMHQAKRQKSDSRATHFMVPFVCHSGKAEP